MLKKHCFKWSEEALKAYETLKQKMDGIPLLTTPNFNLPLEIETDASRIGLGAVLMQQVKPLAFFSQALSDKGRLIPVYERELMAIVLEVQKLRHYLLESHFIIRTDHKSLEVFSGKEIVGW
ncbi:hypothetical protein A2U01_0002896 [Trifolium medium]|uniref:Reverse transcriptase/retrotransposon-derived protein RNase H-like domain-containing protein n=1 Tax=Trifolium medium TaxID=97028 RepID=A0A392M494_9FABA|nr:hypothetical protein [Trifolium medium]